jgi:hypothetical protein
MKDPTWATPEAKNQEGYQMSGGVEFPRLEKQVKSGLPAPVNSSTDLNLPVLLEVWVKIPGWGEKYQVSNMGRVRSTAWGKCEVMNLTIKDTGYPQASFRHNGKQKKVTVHILVALAFLGPRPGVLVINHKDGNKLNNTPENLEYVTVQENNAHAKRTGLNDTMGESNPRAKLTENQVMMVLKELAQGKSQSEIAGSLCVSSSTIQLIASGKNWKHLSRESWRTPSSSECNGGQASPEEMTEAGRTVKLRYQVEGAKIGAQTTAKLNPRWVETLMGLPLGWTSPDAPASVILNWPKFVSGWLRAQTERTSCECAETVLCQPPQSERSGSYTKNSEVKTKKGDNKMLTKLEKLIDSLQFLVDLQTKKAVKEVEGVVLRDATPQEEKGETELQKAERKVRKIRVPKVEAPTVETPSVEDQLGLGEAKAVITQEQRDEMKELSLSTARKFVELFKNATPTGYEQATELAHNVFKVEKITDMTYEQHKEFVAVLEEKMGAKK